MYRAWYLKLGLGVAEDGNSVLQRTIAVVGETVRLVCHGGIDTEEGYD